MAASESEKCLIVNADDLGASEGINRGIFEASEHGIVTSASLMVDMPASEDAVDRLPGPAAISVGLHAALTEQGGALKIDPRDCLVELERQLQRFNYLVGRLPTHLDSHHNVHRDPRFQDQFVAFAQSCELPLRDHSPARHFAGFYGHWNGETQLDRVSAASLGAMLEAEVREGITELACHPGYVDAGLRSSYRLEREAEVRALCDPAVQKRVEQLHIRLISFADVPQVAR